MRKMTQNEEKNGYDNEKKDKKVNDEKERDKT